MSLYKFTFHYIGGKSQDAICDMPEGRSSHIAAARAFSSLGYGNGAVRAIDYWDYKPLCITANCKNTSDDVNSLCVDCEDGNG
jgi:hypothetical protein